MMAGTLKLPVLAQLSVMVHKSAYKNIVIEIQDNCQTNLQNLEIIQTSMSHYLFNVSAAERVLVR